MVIWDAEEDQQQYLQLHSEVAVEKRYIVADKRILELYATYVDERADHRAVFQVINR